MWIRSKYHWGLTLQSAEKTELLRLESPAARGLVRRSGPAWLVATQQHGQMTVGGEQFRDAFVVSAAVRVLQRPPDRHEHAWLHHCEQVLSPRSGDGQAAEHPGEFGASDGPA